MKYSFYLISCIAFSLALFACGDDSSSSPDNVDRDSIESCSSGDSDEILSSSSEEVLESSSSENSKIRRATFEDFEKNMVLKGLFKRDVGLSTGSKNGFFTFWLPGEKADSAWVAVKSNFDEGVININKNNATYATTSDEGTSKLMIKMVTDGAKFTFIINEDEKLKCVFDGDTLDVETAKVMVNSNAITNADKLINKDLNCSLGDTSLVYSFYSGSYSMVQTLKSDTLLWATGYYDIQHSKLMLLTKYASKSYRSLLTVELSSDYVMTDISNNKVDCKLSDISVLSIDENKLVSEWTSVEDNVNWTMKFIDDGTFKILANEGRLDIRNGEWGVFGDVLVLINKQCFDTACKSIMGKIADFDAEKGFSYNHVSSYPKDEEEHPNELPFKWFIPQYE